MKRLTLALILSLLTFSPVTLADAPHSGLPTLAMTVVAEGNQQQKDSFDDLLAVELSHQSVLRIVDRQKMQTILKEHAIALTNIGNAQNAIALGKFVGADCLLHVSMGKKTAALRLVEVASGQVKVEGEVALRDDLTLSAVAIREKVLAALRPESQAAHRLTVGIAAFPNRSGTDRSDKLGIELQKALRKRLQERPWAVVLERQYPTSLLEEVDLARSGLVRQHAVETLPPADLVILGTLEDIGREYAPDKPWDIKADLTLRLRDKSIPILAKCRSNAIETAADDILKTIDDVRRQPASRATVSEKELWRRQALYLMPRPMLSGYDGAMIPELYASNETNKREVIRAWENVLLLDDKNAEAMTYLGVCGIAFSRWFYNESQMFGKEKNTRVAQWIAGSRLLERALEIEPTTARAATYLYCLRPMVDAVPRRAREMAQYVQDHPDRFKGLPESPWVKVALTKPSTTNKDENYQQLDRVLASGANDPNAVLVSLPQRTAKSGTMKRYSELLKKYEDSPDAVVQFAVHRALGEWLLAIKKDEACLKHFDRAIAVMEAAYAKCKSPHRDSLNNIYRLKAEACLLFHREKEAKQTAWAGVEHFMKIGRFDSNEHFTATSSWFYENYIGWLYEYCVTEAHEPGGEKHELDVCNTYLAAAKPVWTLASSWPRISAKREELLTRLAGNQPPDMAATPAVTTWEQDLMATIEDTFVPMAVLNDTLWFGPGKWRPLHSYDDRGVVQVNNSYSAFGVAACQGALFHGSSEGLSKFDAAGKLLKRYGRQGASLPGSIDDVCEGNGKLYFSFRGSPCGGIAVLDPATDKVTVIAPSTREATAATEPTDGISCISWDAAEQRLFVHDYFHRQYGSPILTSVYGWSAKDATWRRLPPGEAPHFVVSNGDETLLTRVVGDQTEFRFIKSGQKLMAGVPVPTLLGRPAWDEHHIWAPTASGLYEIDRATGKMIWLAYADGNFFRAVLKTADRLYISTNHGIYYRDLSAMATAKASTKTNATTADAVARKPAPKAASIILPVEISLEDNPKAKDSSSAKPEVIVQLDHRQTLQKTPPGTVNVDLSPAGNGEHFIYFHSPGYASQWVYVKIADGKASLREAKAKLFRNRYVILRCAFNTNGDRSLEGDDVDEQHVALSHWTSAKPFGQDWQIWQKKRNSGNNCDFGDTPYLEFHRWSFNGFGFARPAPGVSYQQMKEAPDAGYRCENIRAEKGLLLYCHVAGNIGTGLGYGKILVEAVTEELPEDVRLVTQREQ